jgi:hypothetical protein
MKNYQSPEVVEVGKADQIILGSKVGIEFDAAEQEYTRPLATVVDQD